MADFLQRMAPYLSIIEIVLAVVVILLVLIQAKGSDLGGFLGGGESTFRTRRGVEATLYRATVGFFILFFVVTFLTFLALGQG
jgi:preprotein translocase subunit SecG